MRNSLLSLNKQTELPFVNLDPMVPAAAEGNVPTAGAPTLHVPVIQKVPQHTIDLGGIGELLEKGEMAELCTHTATRSSPKTIRFGDEGHRTIQNIVQVKVGYLYLDRLHPQPKGYSIAKMYCSKQI